jgi:hypothetical protein
LLVRGFASERSLQHRGGVRKERRTQLIQGHLRLCVTILLLCILKHIVDKVQCVESLREIRGTINEFAHESGNLLGLSGALKNPVLRCLDALFGWQQRAKEFLKARSLLATERLVRGELIGCWD